MFIDAKNSINWANSFIKLSPVALILSGSPVFAAECGVLHLQTACNLEATVTGNKCSSKTNLSNQSIISLPKDSRIWLDSIDTLQTSEHYQIVCLNKSSTVQKIQIVGENYPWLKPLEGCGEWLDNRLMCKQHAHQANPLLCVAVPKAQPVKQPVSFRTSVTVRGIEPRLPNEYYNWTDLIKPNIELCRQLLNATQAITLNWTLNMSGKVSQASVAERGIDKQFFDCALDALKNTVFPSVAHDMRLKAAF